MENLSETGEKTKLPDAIPLLGRVIKIEEVSERPKNDKGEQLDGCYDHGKRAIVVFSDMSMEDKLDTLYHEAAHCYQTFLGWDQNLSEQEQELLCQMMSLFVVDIIRGLK